MNRNLKKVA